MARSRVSFGGLAITYDDRVLEPRAWTQAQAEWAAELAGRVPHGPMLELCAGAGQIGLLATALTSRPLLSVDVNPAAVELTRLNAEEAGVADRVETRLADVRSALRADEQFPLVIADPPWVPTPNVGDHPDDPESAINGGPDGLDTARLCLAVIARHLRPGGSAILQLGSRAQSRAMHALLPEGLVSVEARRLDGGLLWRVDRDQSPLGSGL